MNNRIITSILMAFVLVTTAQAGIPVWTFAPVAGYPTAITISASETKTIQYTVTNQSSKSHILQMKSIQGITPSGCSSPLGYRQTCTLNLTVSGSALRGDVMSGPVLCEQNNSNMCYQPSAANSLAIRFTSSPTPPTPPVQQYTITSSAGVNGAISPSTASVVNAGAALTFTATPNAGYMVNQWFVDGTLVQTGDTTYQLQNISANNTVNVTFTTYLPICTVVGGDNSNGTTLLYQSTNGGITWGLPATPIAVPGGFNATSCSGVGSSAICIAAGRDNNNMPMLYQSQNRGSTWNQVAFTSPNQGIFNATSCSGTGSSAICIAAGEDYTAGGIPLLYQSTNGGSSWSQITFSSPDQGIFNAASCSGSGSTTTCIAAGNNNSTGAQLLYQSINGGNWNAVPTIVTLGYLSSTFCGGSGSSALCLAAGEDVSFGASTTFINRNQGGGAWDPVATGNPGSFNGVSCGGSGSFALCTAAGSENSDPMLYQSLNGGSTWSQFVIADLSTGNFNATSCSATGNICIVAGSGTVLGVPSRRLYQTIDGGITWPEVNTVTGVPTNAIFGSTSCSATGASAVCTAAVLSPPRLYQTINGGNTWTQVVVTAVNEGAFNSTSCSQ